MKRQGLSFAARLNAWFAAVVILLSVALFLIAYLLLYPPYRNATAKLCRRNWRFITHGMRKAVCPR